MTHAGQVMKSIDRRILNGVEYFQIMRPSARQSPTVVYIPGLLSEAEEAFGAVMRLVTLNSVFLNLRGRGHSHTPVRGYDLDGQAEDVLRVTRGLALDVVCLVGHSVGGAIAVRAYREMGAAVRAIVLCDYLPVYPSLSQDWLSGNLSPENPRRINALIKKLQRDATRVDMMPEFASTGIPRLILCGESEGAHMTAAWQGKLRAMLPDVQISVISGAGHELFADAPQATLDAVETFAGAATA